MPLLAMFSVNEGSSNPASLLFLCSSKWRIAAASTGLVAAAASAALDSFGGGGAWGAGAALLGARAVGWVGRGGRSAIGRAWVPLGGG